MDSKTYTVVYKQWMTDDTFILHLKPEDKDVLTFQAGQYANIINPQFENPEEEHPYSIASSVNNKEYLEFCVKIYGDWTTFFSKIKVGDTLKVNGPYGSFMWEENDKNCVFLVGGVGISTFMSMLRTISEGKNDSKVTLLYGNRTDKTIVYRKEIDTLIQKIGHGSKVVHILSHLKPEEKWEGYRGFLTREIIEKEVDLSSHPTFFMVGPPIFIDLINKLLKEMNIEEKYIKHESL